MNWSVSQEQTEKHSRLKQMLDEHHEGNNPKRRTGSNVESHLEQALTEELPTDAEFHVRSALRALDGNDA
jgi:hypothetical protein